MISDGSAKGHRLGVGIDLVQVSRIAESLERFGDRFLRRIFTEQEIAYATSAPHLTAERLASRFAAKEATVKALDLSEQGIGFTQIEVTREDSGVCRLKLHGRARAVAQETGIEELAVSLSHEGDFAAAVVFTMREKT